MSFVKKKDGLSNLCSICKIEFTNDVTHEAYKLNCGCSFGFKCISYLVLCTNQAHCPGCYTEVDKSQYSKEFKISKTHPLPYNPKENLNEMMDFNYLFKQTYQNIKTPLYNVTDIVTTTDDLNDTMKFYAIDYHKDHFIVSVSSVNEDGYITYALSAYNDRLGNICTTNTENQIIGLSINKTDEIMTRSLRIIAVTNMNEYYIFVYDMITNQFHINPLRNDSRCSSDFSDLGAICWSGDRSVGIGCHNSTFLFAEFELGKKNEILITDTTIPNGQGKQISFVNEYGPGIFLGVNKGSLYYFKEGKSPGLIFNTRDNSKITSFQYDAPSQLAAVFTGDPKNASGRSVNCFWFRVNRTRDLIHRVTHFHLNPITHFLAPTTFSAIPVVMPGKTSNHSLLAFYVSIYGKVVAVINGKHGFFEIDDIGNKGRPINCTIIKKSSINEKENFSISVCLHYRNHINTKIIAINVKNFEIFEKN